MASALEERFSSLWSHFGTGDEPVREHQFAADIGRRWRADFAWPDFGLLVEIEGGQFSRGRHQRANGYSADCEKYNAATILGWSILRYTRKDLDERPYGICEEVAEMIRRRKAKTA